LWREEGKEPEERVLDPPLPRRGMAVADDDFQQTARNAYRFALGF